MHIRTQFAHKVIKVVQKEEKDKIRSNNIPENEWLEYYAEFWCDQKVTESRWFRLQRRNYDTSLEKLKFGNRLDLMALMQSC